jgi:hypothetical protein
MALTKVGKEGITGIDNSSDATAITIDSSERVLIGTTTEGDASADDLTVASSGNTGITIRAGTSNSSSIYMSDATSGAGEYAGYIAYAHASNSMSFGTNGGASMSIDSTGAVTMPKQPAFMAKPASNQSNPASNTVIEFGTEIFDQNADFNTSTHTFTAPVTGRYLMCLSMRMDSVDADMNYCRFKIETSNRTYDSNIIDPGVFNGDPTYWNFQTTVLADMDASDTAVIKWNYSGGTNQADTSTDSTFSGHLVC